MRKSSIGIFDRALKSNAAWAQAWKHLALPRETPRAKKSSTETAKTFSALTSPIRALALRQMASAALIERNCSVTTVSKVSSEGLALRKDGVPWIA